MRRRERPHGSCEGSPTVDVEHLGLLDRATELPPHLGYVEVSGRQPGLRCHDPVEAVRVLSNQAESDQPAPILADVVTSRRSKWSKTSSRIQSTDQGVVTIRLMDRLVRAAETDQVRHHAPDPAVGEHPDRLPVEERPARLTAQYHDPMSNVSRRNLICAASMGVAGPLVIDDAASAAGGAVIAVAKVPVGGGVVVTQRGVVVTQPRKGRFRVFSATCTHAGCTVSSVVARRINCPCHGSQFAISDGSVMAGPAKAPLSPRSFKIRLGRLYLT